MSSKPLDIVVYRIDYIYKANNNNRYRRYASSKNSSKYNLKKLKFQNRNKVFILLSLIRFKKYKMMISDYQKNIL